MRKGGKCCSTGSGAVFSQASVKCPTLSAGLFSGSRVGIGRVQAVQRSVRELARMLRTGLGGTETTFVLELCLVSVGLLPNPEREYTSRRVIEHGEVSDDPLGHELQWQPERLLLKQNGP